MTVQQLRNNGYKVRVLHCRLYNGYHTWQNGSREYIQQNAPVDPDGKHFRGLAMCSKKENYNKKMGVRIALGRSGVIV